MKTIELCFFILLFGFPGIAQENITIKFKIDAKELKDPKSLGIRGNTLPLNWEKTLVFEDLDKDGVFEGEIRFLGRTEDIIEYKFVYGDKKTTYELEGQNRILFVSECEIEKNLTWNVPDAIDLESLPKLNSEKLLADFEIFKSALLEIHPGLYRFRTKIEIDSVFNHYQSVFSEPMSYEAAFLNFTRITSFIHCGHTFPSFFNQNSFIKQVVLDRNDKLPFTFRVLENRMFITENVSEEMDFPFGTEILSINGIKTSDFLNQTASLVKADGTNDNKRFIDLNTFGIGDFEMFDAYFPLVFPPKNERYSLELIKPNSTQPEIVNLNTISREERKVRLKQKYPNFPTQPSELWKLEFWENNTAYLQLGTFDGFQLSFEWKTFLKNAFDKINQNKTENLVIDIRWNEGGQDDILLYLGENIAKTKLTISQKKDLVRYTKVSEKLRPYLSTWDNTYFDLTQKVEEFDSSFYTLNQQSEIEIKPNSKAFNGEIYLLINASNSSASFYFAEIAKENNLATLVGETTGGNQQGLNAGTMFFLRLPNSQIEIDIPIIGTFSNDKPFGGIVPDVVVSETYEDIVTKTDAVIEKTKQLIRKD